jgi:mono/diheme cytochrome c family protein
MEEEKFKSEIDWKDLFKKPIKLFGYSYFYFLASLITLGLLYLWNLNTIGRNSVTPVLLKDSTALIQDIPFQSPRIIPPVNVMKAGVSSTESISKGRELYKNSCAACHGENGLGDGISASMLNPKPRNLHSLSGWKNGSKVTQIYKTLQEGISGSAMASYNYMPPEERFALIHYIRTFGGNQPQDSENDLKQLDGAYALSKGMNVTGQISIKKAMSIAVKESKLQIAEIEQVKKALKESSAEGASILRRASNDETKILTMLLQNKKSLTSLNELIMVITADPLHAGFKVNVTSLSASEWSEMYGFILTLRKKESRL